MFCVVLYRNRKGRGEEMAWSAKRMLHNHEDLGLNPQSHVKSQG